MKPLGILLLIILIPVAIVGGVLWGLLNCVIEFLDFVKSYFELIKNECNN